MFRLLVVLFACVSAILAADPQDHVSKSIPASSATRLVLNADVGSIHVEPGNTTDVEVYVYFHGQPDSRAEFDRMLRDFTLDIAHQGSDIRATGAFHKGWQPMLLSWPLIFGAHAFCRRGDCLEYGTWLRDVEYRVTIPERFGADVDTAAGPISIRGLNGEVNARTSGGGVTLENDKGRATVHTSGGPIRITEVGGDVEASTSGGPISIERNKGRVTAHTSGGPIEIREAMGSINASTSGGPVTASLVTQPKEECRLYTSGGSINVTLRKDVHMDLDASTSGGRVMTNFAVEQADSRHGNVLRTPINGGGPLLYLHTSGGAINVRRDD